MGLVVSHQNKTVVVELKGDMRKSEIADSLRGTLKDASDIFVVRGDDLQFWDSTTVAILYQIMLQVKQVKFQNVPSGLKKMAQLALKVNNSPRLKKVQFDFFTSIGNYVVDCWVSVCRAFDFLKQIFGSFLRAVQGKSSGRLDDWWEAFANSGYRAVGIVFLSCFITGLILAFVGSLQLQMFGAQVYIASLVTIGMVRIMGAIMMGVIMAGRSGAQMAAVIGSMKVNEELDAIKTFGLSVMDMVSLPRIVALTFSGPFLTIFADIAGIMGGMLVAVLMFDISAAQYWYYAVQAFSLRDFVIGIIHGGLYGFIISSCGCYYGINCGKDARSVGNAATKAVVSSIVIMIVITGILTWLIEGLGL